MSTYYYGPALDSEIDYRRDMLLRDAATHRLARKARRARAATRPGTGRVRATRPAEAVRPSAAATVQAPAQTAENPTARAA